VGGEFGEGLELSSEFVHRTAAISHGATDLSVVGAAVIVNVFSFAIAEAERASASVADHWNVFDPTEAHDFFASTG
jgi:hypothetical protein